MKRKRIWTAGIIVLLLAVMFAVPEIYSYVTERNYESEEVAASEVPEGYETATLAGGCFWCMEPPFEKLKGVHSVVSGYTGGDVENPTYEEVSSGGTGHIESVQVYFDPEVISYEQILDVFWKQINPTDDEGQFVDRGYQYTTAVFYHNEQQKQTAEQSRRELGSPAASIRTSSHRSLKQRRFTGRKNTIRIIIRRINSVTTTTAEIPGVTSTLKIRGGKI